MYSSSMSSSSSDSSSSHGSIMGLELLSFGPVDGFADAHSGNCSGALFCVLFFFASSSFLVLAPEIYDMIAKFSTLRFVSLHLCS